MEKNRLEPKHPRYLAAFFAHRIIFFLHLFLYIAVIALLILIWAVSIGIVPGLPSIAAFWPIHAIFGWGIGIGFHATAYVMYNDKISYLAKIRRTSVFGTLFIFHAWFYAIVNIYLMVINMLMLAYLPYLWFLWVLFLWGIGFVFHAIGFFTWDSFFGTLEPDVKAKFPDYSEKRVKKFTAMYIVQLWLLFAHIAYFIVASILQFVVPIMYPGIVTYGAVSNPVNNTIGWGIIVGLHALEYYFFVIEVKLNSVKKSLYWHLISYAIINIYLIYQQYLSLSLSPTIWIHFSLILWAILIAIHTILVFKWEDLLASTTEMVKSRTSETLEDYEYRWKGAYLVIWPASLISHVLIYIVGLILIAIQFVVLSIPMITLIPPTMGWLIAIFIHAACYLIILKQIRAFLMWTLVLHLSVYIPVLVYLVILNVLFDPGFAWSAIAIAGWFIGVGFHMVLAFLTKKK